MQTPRLHLNASLSTIRAIWQKVSLVVNLLALLAIFPGMLVVQFGIELATGTLSPDPKIKMPGLSIAALGFVFLLGLVFLMEFTTPPLVKSSGCEDTLPYRYQAREVDHLTSRATLVLVLMFQAIVILLYAGFLDGGLRMRGALYSFLCYLVGVVVVFARRGFALTKGDLIWVKWAWLPIITFGVPLYVSVSNGKWPIG